MTSCRDAVSEKTLSSLRPQNILIITSSGGGGHLQAAKAKYADTAKEYPEAKIIKQDLLLDWAGKYVGKFFVNKWNKAQRAGDIIELERLISYQPLAEKILYVPIFVNTLRILLREDIDLIIDTQPIGTPAIIRAMKIARNIRKKPLILEKIVTELPTEEVTHFFRPIKNLSEEDRRLIRLISTMPLTTNDESDTLFWEEHCGMQLDSVSYEKFPLRPTFSKYLGKQRTENVIEVDIPLPHAVERKLVMHTVSHGSTPVNENRNLISVTIQPEDKVSVLMLGSNPDERALLQYIQHFIDISMKKGYKKRRDLLFVFCCDSTKNEFPLQKKIEKMVAEQPNYPKSLTIFPLSFHDDEVIAPLFFRSDATFTRSGGLTSMELLSVCQGYMWIHRAEPVKKYRLLRQSRYNALGMPPWENGNALYLKEKKGAGFVTPDTFYENCHDFFSLDDN